MTIRTNKRKKDQFNQTKKKNREKQARAPKQDRLTSKNTIKKEEKRTTKEKDVTNSFIRLLDYFFLPFVLFALCLVLLLS